MTAPPLAPLSPPVSVPYAPPVPLSPAGAVPASEAAMERDGVDAPLAATTRLAAAAALSAPGAIEQVVRAHQALAAVAARIADEVIACVPVDQLVLIQDAEGTGLIAAFRAVRAQAILLRHALDAVASPVAGDMGREGEAGDAQPDARALAFAPPAAGLAVSAAVKAGDALALPLKHIAALFQSRVSGLEARLVHADEAPLVAELARRLRDGGRRVLYPRALPLELRDPAPALATITALIDAAVTSLDAAAARVSALTAPRKAQAAADLAVLASAVTQLRKQLFALPDSTPAAMDARALIEGADRVRELDAGAALLSVQIAATGSSPRQATLLHWKPAYTGGAVVSYFLASGDAVLLRSGTLGEYSSFREPASF